MGDRKASQSCDPYAGSCMIGQDPDDRHDPIFRERRPFQGSIKVQWVKQILLIDLFNRLAEDRLQDASNQAESKIGITEYLARSMEPASFYRFRIGGSFQQQPFQTVRVCESGGVREKMMQPDFPEFINLLSFRQKLINRSFPIQEPLIHQDCT